MKYLLLSFLSVIFLAGCSKINDQQQPVPTEAEKIIHRAIENHGGDLYDSASISFTFRNKDYTYARVKGKYSYTREFDDSIGKVYDVLDNEGFKRYVNDNITDLDEEMSGRYAQSVNSVWYFALLPFPLADPAVNLSYQGQSIVNEKTYDLIRVSFDEDRGGEDHSDIFMYWFHTSDASIGYIAYRYETEGGGVRFREAVNRRKVGGIVFYDYINYKPKNKDTPLSALDSLFMKGDLEKVSEITLENIQVDAGA